KVVADHQIAHTQSVDQYAPDEFLRGQFRKGAIKAQTQHPIDRKAPQCDQLFAKSRQARRRLRRREILLRLRLENNDRGRQSKLGCALSKLPEDRLMAEMHAIEVADGRRTAA